MRRLPALPFRPTLESGEALASVVSRLAAAFGIPASTMLTRLGLTEDAGQRPPAFGVVLDSRRTTDLARVARVSAVEVSGMLLSQYDGRVLNLSSLDLRAPQTVRRAGATQWALFASSRFCPDCLRESSGAWRTAWKLTLTFACVRHRRLLVDCCPRCGNRPGAPLARRLDRREAPASARCANAAPGRTRSCANRLDEVGSHMLEVSHPVLEAQRKIDAALRAGSPRPLADLQGACSLALRHMATEDVADMAPELAPVVERYAAWRDGGRRPEARTADTFGFPHRSPDPPGETSLTAAAVLMGLPIASATEPESLDRLVSHLVSRAHAQPQRALVWRSEPHRWLSPRLSSAWRRCAAQATFARSSTRERIRDRLCGAAVLAAANIPQLLWRHEYLDHLAELLPAVGEEAARRFASVALVRLVEGCGWADAVELLDLESRWTQLGGGRCMRVLRGDGRDAIFFSRLTQIHQRQAERTLVDYSRRRLRLVRWRGLSARQWRQVDASAGRPRRGRPDLAARRVHASVWLWTELTGSADRDCPVSHLTTGKAYRHFVRVHLDSHRPGLLAAGEEVLRGAGE